MTFASAARVGVPWGIAVRRAIQQQSPSEWPLGLRRGFTTLVATGACVAVLWLADGAGQWQAWDEHEQRRHALQAQRTQHAQDLARWRSIPSLGTTGSTPPPQALLHAWSDAATQTGWQVVSSHTAVQADGGTALHLLLTGRFADWPRVWARWQEHAAFVTVRRWQMEALSPQRVRVEVLAEWVVQRGDDEALPQDATAPSTPLAERDPFSVQVWVQHQWQQAQTDARVAQWLPHWRRAPTALTQARDSDLRYRGRIQSQARDVALVQIAGADAATASGDATRLDRVHAVAVGDALGPDLGQVVQIDDERLVLQQWRRDAAGVWHARARVLLRDAAAPANPGARP